MAIVRNPEDLSNATNYVATIAFFCCISCITLILKFGGFKASLNIFKGKNDKESKHRETGLIMNGAYRTNRDEFFGHGRSSDPPRKVTPPREDNLHAINPANSTNNPSKLEAAPILQLNKRNTPNESQDATNQASKNSRSSMIRQRHHDKQEKQRLAEQRELEKAAAKEKAKQDKMQQKATKETQAKGKKDKRKAPTPQQVQVERHELPSDSRPEPVNVVLKTNASYSTNTLESSISRSSGPPPYSEDPQPASGTNQTNTTGNVTFGKPIETSSWDMISEHRQQVSRTTNSETKNNKQTVMDLNYNFGKVSQQERDNSEV